VDFGLAAGIEPASRPFSIAEVFPESGLTQAGRVAGTAGYIAPEHLAGRVADARADQFAFCVALYEAFEGRRPYEPSELEALAQGKPALPRPRFRRTPLWLRGLVARGLAANPDLRFPHMDTLLSRLERARALPRRALFSFAVVVTASVGLFLTLWMNEAAARVEAQARQERNATRMSVARELQLSDPTTALALLREVEPPEVPRGWSELSRRVLQARVARVVLVHPDTVSWWRGALTALASPPRPWTLL
jgi:serine/threonine protein kinase